MQTILEAWRTVVGEPEFYVRLGGSTSNYSWDYGAMIEYIMVSLVVLVVVSSVFRILGKLFG